MDEAEECQGIAGQVTWVSKWAGVSMAHPASGQGCSLGIPGQCQALGLLCYPILYRQLFFLNEIGFV